MTEHRFKMGDKVMYRGEVWEVGKLSFTHNVPDVVGGILPGYGIRRKVSKKNGVSWVEKRYADEWELAAIPPAPTIADMAEKLTKVFKDGARVAAVAEDYDACDGMKCGECPFRREKLQAAGFCGNCNSLVWYKPDLAMRLMDEWLAERDKPKGKTYREDFLRKMPHAVINASRGVPAACRANAYGESEGTRKICALADKYSCEKCWNAVMPEEKDNAEG